jgi:hypothetical protein
MYCGDDVGEMTANSLRNRMASCPAAEIAVVVLQTVEVLWNQCRSAENVRGFGKIHEQ